MSTNNGKIEPKFQESLDELLYDEDLSITGIHSIDTLQELIEEHQKNLTYISTLEKILKETDKALESACQIIAKCKCFKGCPFEEDCNEVDCFDGNVWKEHFLEESEKE